jgi:tetratricopeptide (TPR) repeat protein
MSAPQAKSGLIKEKYFPWLAALLLLTLVVFYSSLQNGFTNWDDDVYVTQNPVVQELSGENVAAMFGEFQAGLYQPITMLSLALDWETGAGSPFVFHLTNLLLHLLNTLLVFVVIRRLFSVNRIALIAAVLFGVHTLHVESVVWVTERKDVLYALFYLLAIWQYVSYAQGKKMKNYSIALVLFTLALMTKGMAVALAPSLLLIDFSLQRKGELKRVLIEKIPFFALAIFFGYLAIQGQSQSGAHDVTQNQGLVRQGAFAGYALWTYFGKLLAPINLSAIYSYPAAVGTGLGIYWIFPALSLGVLGVLLWLRKKQRILFFGLAFFLVNIVLVLQVLPVGVGFMSDRFAYVSSIGIFVMLGFAFHHFYEKKQAIRGVLVALGLGYILFLSVLTFQRSKIWENSFTLWDDAIQKDDSQFLPYSNRGLFLMENGDPQAALHDFSTSLQLDQSHAKTWYNRGTAYASMSDFQAAITDFSHAIQLYPEYADAFANRGLMKASLGLDNQAIKDYNQALEFNPIQINALTNRGTAYYYTKQFDKAMVDLNKAIALNPFESLALYIRGMCHFERGEQALGCADLQESYHLGFQAAGPTLDQYCNQ